MEARSALHCCPLQPGNDIRTLLFCYRAWLPGLCALVVGARTSFHGSTE